MPGNIAIKKQVLPFRVLIVVLGLAALWPDRSQAQTAREKLINLAKTQTSNGGQILQRVGDFEFEEYLTKNDSAGLLEDFGTVIHESCHHLNFLISNENRESNRKYQSYFISKEVNIVAEQGPVFNSVKLNSIVPKNLQKEIFRYQTYVGNPQKSLGSQVDGIYGMVEELCAYYQGTKACFELYDFYFKNRCSGFKNTGEWANYVQHIAGSYFAYYEFRLFISWYLEYAQQHEREVYTSCMDNIQLRTAYTLLDNQFGQLVRDFETRLKELAINLSKGIIKVEIADYENERSFIVTTKQSTTRTSTQVYSIFSNRIKLIEGLLEGKQNAILETFRIKL